MLDEPSAPGKPTPLDWGPKSCQLAWKPPVTDVFYDNCVVHWTPPLDDGGTEIKHYVVEALDVSSGGDLWQVMDKTSSGSLRQLKIENLNHGHRYRFRVRAVNKLGKSDPRNMSGDDVLIKDPWGNPPSFNRKEFAFIL